LIPSTALRSVKGPKPSGWGRSVSSRGPVIIIPNAKTAKVFTLRDKYHLELNFQDYNILSNSSAVATNYLYSPTTFNLVTSIVLPRVARVGTLFSFRKVLFADTLRCWREFACGVTV
jgi:hypothetical protein